MEAAERRRENCAGVRLWASQVAAIEVAEEAEERVGSGMVGGFDTMTAVVLLWDELAVV